ncbi:Hypothetical protein R9X50_00344200 [Acrodontium crateriforme]|uniref:DUF1907 domain-containing protein n=1 Tax=Acrodontium crateriforme TaxID=150365 RepID=A0AAQ3M2J7_9PEZI|nr:Hypothetical protein R9X50_00344200 [Acrodontium crateriforme]
MISMQTTQHKLSPPSLEELAATLDLAVKKNYIHASASVIKCPDLRQEPFCLATQGLSGDECVADIGGQTHLYPRPLFDKKYSLIECAKAMNMSPDQGSLIGAGAGPFHVVGQNSELAPNLSWKDGFENINNLTCVAKIDIASSSDGKAVCEQCSTTECALMMNLFGSSGLTGPVLKITARGRIGDGKSFSEFLRDALHSEWSQRRQVTIGGVFLIKTGKALFHIMPDFPAEKDLPFNSRQAVDSWLTFHRFEAPIVCLTVFHSSGPENLALRMEHTHCFSAEGENAGGHYHYDLSVDEEGAEEIEYEAYLNTAKTLYRIDRPE